MISITLATPPPLRWETIKAEENKEKSLFSGAAVGEHQAGGIQTPTWQKIGSPATSVIGQRSPTGSSGRLGAIETETVRNDHLTSGGGRLGGGAVRSLTLREAASLPAAGGGRAARRGAIVRICQRQGLTSGAACCYGEKLPVFRSPPPPSQPRPALGLVPY